MVDSRDRGSQPAKGDARSGSFTGPKFLDNGTEELLHWPEPIDLRALAQTQPVQPRMIINDWLPCGYATLMAGHGGIGKSGIALHLAVCIAQGKLFFGLHVQRRRVLYLSCEDRENVLHWRLSRICKYLGVGLDSLHGHLNILDLVGHDAVLFERDPRSGKSLTMGYWLLQQHIQKHEIDLLIVDGIADTFGGNENSRCEVKRFVNALVSLIPMDTGAVLLIGHIAKPAASGITISEGYSGSTGWHNAVRARCYLHPEFQTTEDGEQAERTGELLLDLQKSNLGRSERSMRFKWDDDAQLFIGSEVIGTSKADLKLRDEDEQRGILAALRDCTSAGDYVPAATMGKRTAYNVLRAQTKFPKSLLGKAGKNRFWRHIEGLRRQGIIREGARRRQDRKTTLTIELSASGGVGACG